MKTAWSSEEFKYLEFFGFHQNPFPISPDTNNFFISKHIDQILTDIIHGVMARKGFMVLAGDVGLGKTTVSRRILEALAEKDVETSLVFHTSYQDVELLREINRDFGIKLNGLNYGDQVKSLNDFLLDQNSQGKNCAIIIDDAQNLDHKSLELVRMISNLELDQHKLVQILLIGQPELMEKLNSKELRQLRSRIIIQEQAIPLSLDELKNYLSFKFNVSGNKGQVTVKKAAIKRIHRLTKGNLRQINVLMDRCLYVAFFHTTMEISKNMVDEAHRDLVRFHQTNRTQFVKWGIFFAIILLLLMLGTFLHLKAPMPENQTDAKNLNQSVQKLNPQEIGGEGVGTGEHGFFNPLQTWKTSKPVAKKEKNTVPNPIIEFMTSYQLSEYTSLFYQTLQNRRFDVFSTMIFAQKGLELIQLERVTNELKSQYGILAFPLNDGGKNFYYLFWKPQLTIKDYYFYYRGEEIRLLQENLSQLNFYTDRLDGIVGRNLLKAVGQFQNKMALPETGYPDKKTIFFLYHYKGNMNE